MARRSHITDHDKGYKRLFERVARAALGVHVNVGILGETGDIPHRAEINAEEKKELKALRALSRRGAFLTAGQHARTATLARKSDSSITIGEIGEIHEFGLGNNPVRSWLRGYVDLNREKIAEKVKRVAREVEAGKMTPERAMDLLGFSIVGGIQKRIAAGIAPTVTPATQARKGPTKTTALINSGQFRSSISHKVETGP